MPLFLVRFAETGREAQPGRSKTRRDIEEMIGAALPGAAIRAAPGRLLVETPEATSAGTDDAAKALGRIHGVASFSPCEACAPGALEACVVRVATRALAGRTRFRVQVRRAGAHGFTSRQKSAALGACIQAALPHAVVDLAAPEVVIGVEIRDHDCSCAGHGTSSASSSRATGRRRRRSRRGRCSCRRRRRSRSWPRWRAASVCASTSSAV